MTENTHDVSSLDAWSRHGIGVSGCGRAASVAGEFPPELQRYLACALNRPKWSLPIPGSRWAGSPLLDGLRKRIVRYPACKGESGEKLQIYLWNLGRAPQSAWPLLVSAG
ncbi:hypothetical protein PCLA_13r0132 [Pseudomonas citronellolis]|nr:hypothetical protein PCLA_13r0132 [Pseudomonas citronellolis]